MKKKCLLIIGVRRACYNAALELGHSVVLWSDGPLAKKRQKNLLGWIEQPYDDSLGGLSQSLIEELSRFDIETVIANTEEAVVLGARVREHLGLKRMAVDVVERFHNKLIMKNHARDCNIPITRYQIIDESTKGEDLEASLGLPLVIKPVDGSGAQGVKVARTLGEVKAAMKTGLLAEAFVNGNELSVETFVHDGKPLFHNLTEYLHQWKKSVVPAQLTSEIKTKVLQINDAVIEKFAVDRGVTHAEFYLTDKGPVFGEIAIRPPGGYYMDLIDRVYGFNSWQTYIKLSCGDLVDIPSQARGCAAVYMIHPGAGRIKTIHGIEAVKKNVEDIFEFSIRRGPGDEILTHENTSNEIGHLLFWANSRPELDRKIQYIESTLKFDLTPLGQ